MIANLSHRALPALVALCALVLTGCLEQTDTIEVRPDGSTGLTVEFSGDADQVKKIVALPSAPTWTITQNAIDSTPSKKPQFHFTAEIDVPYGRPLPHTFAGAAAPDREQQLQFPSEVKMWKEGRRTYYEFRRTYQARRYACYNLSTSQYWDQNLEDSVVQQGIFNVTEQQRNDYLQQYGMVYGYLQWRMHWQAMADLVRNELLDNAVRDRIDSAAEAYLQATITNDLLLTLLKRGEDSLDAALDSITGAIDVYYDSLLTAATGSQPAGLMAAYRESLASYRHDYDITEALGAQSFSVDLTLPGVLLDANGTIDPDKPGKVEWEFKGADLHDHDIPLYALSFVESR